MLIKQISDSDNLQYNDLATKYGTFHNTIDWLKIFGDKTVIYGIYDKGNNLLGGFCIYKEKKFGLSVYRNPPFTHVMGPFLRIQAQNPVAIMNLWKKVLSSIVDFIEDLSGSIVSVTLNKNIVDTQPFIWRKFKVTPRYTYILDLSKSTDDLRKRMSAERRHAMNKAIKDGLVANMVESYDTVKSLILKTFSRQKIALNEYYLDKILFEFANKDNSFAFVTYKDGRPTAASFCIYDKDTAYYLIGGYDYESKHQGAGALAMWQSIEEAKKLGLKYFDFEGSMVPQIERYFRAFGGELKVYYRVHKAKLPLEILLKFFKREFF